MQRRFLGTLQPNEGSARTPLRATTAVGTLIHMHLFASIETLQLVISRLWTTPGKRGDDPFPASGSPYLAAGKSLSMSELLAQRKTPIASDSPVENNNNNNNEHSPLLRDSACNKNLILCNGTLLTPLSSIIAQTGIRRSKISIETRNMY